MGRIAVTPDIFIQTELTNGFRNRQATTHEHVSDTREDVQSIRTKLDDIHRWYEDNLKCSSQSANRPQNHHSSSCDTGTFALYEERGSSGEVRDIVCPRATLEDIWADDLEPQNAMPGQNLFRCGCSSSHALQYTRKQEGPHTNPQFSKADLP